MAEPINQTTVIGPDTQIKGEMTFEGSAKILGKFDGKISSKGEVQIGDGAVCKATIDAGTVIVDGEISGNVTARDKVKLNSSAKITGDVTARTLIVAEGASFQGNYQVGAEAVEKAIASQAAAAGSTTTEASAVIETRTNRTPVTGGRLSSWNTNGKHETAGASSAE